MKVLFARFPGIDVLSTLNQDIRSHELKDHSVFAFDNIHYNMVCGLDDLFLIHLVT